MAGPDARPTQDELTRLIGELQEGSGSAAGRLLPVVYDELRGLAEAHFKGQRPDHTLQPTALVHEAFLRLTGNSALEWQGRSQFLALAAKAMRHALADHARRKGALKRGAGRDRVTLSAVGSDGNQRVYDALDIDAALVDLTAWNERLATLVELRFFAGLTVEQAGQVLGVGESMVRKEWALARAWLRDRLQTTHP